MSKNSREQLDKKAFYKREKRRKNPEGVRQYQREYYAKNRKVILEKNEVWRQKNYTQVSAKAKITSANYRAKNVSEIDRKARERHYKNNFNMCLAEYEALLDDQGHACAICHIKHDQYIARHKKRFAVDHCHTGGHNRGLLCMKCNTGLGQFLDNTTSLSNAISYLTRNANN